VTGGAFVWRRARVEANQVRLGHLQGLGAVECARIGYYDQDTFSYRYLELDRHLEILSLTGNISLRGGEPAVHAHVTLADDQGQSFGGHLVPGTRVFAFEFVIQELRGAELHRGHDSETGLPLWEQ
jgi:predicted DNA-binding protein with PD1-like motif